MEETLALGWFGSFQGGVDSLQPPFNDSQVGEDKLQVHSGDISRYVQAAFTMGDTVIGKSTDHIDKGICLAELVEEFTTYALAFGQAANNPDLIRRHKFDR